MEKFLEENTTIYVKLSGRKLPGLEGNWIMKKRFWHFTKILAIFMGHSRGNRRPESNAAKKNKNIDKKNIDKYRIVKLFSLFHFKNTTNTAMINV